MEEATFWYVEMQYSCGFMDDKIGVGVCIKDNEYQFIKVKSITYSSLLHVRDCGAHGLLQAIKWINEHEYSPIVHRLRLSVWS